MRTVGLLGFVFVAGCAPLPTKPEIHGPTDASEAGTPPSATREMVWVRRSGTLRIERTAVCQRGAKASDSCTRISRADHEALERFFGSANFRQRWDAFAPCTARTADDEQAFKVTFSDGHEIGKALDHTFGPMTRPCDRRTHDTIVDIGDDLVRRYFGRDP